MPDTPSRLPPGPPRAPGAAARECDEWLRQARLAERRRGFAPHPPAVGRPAVALRITTPTRPSRKGGW